MNPAPPPNYNRIARLYRWLEYASLGPMLARTRNLHLARLTGCRRALILGDGDGRFTARLLVRNPTLQVDAVDISPAMLALLRRRSAPFAARLQTHLADIRLYTPQQQPDLIVTHFLLDCLHQPEVDALIARLALAAAPRALWLVSDFRIPTGPLRLPARAIVRLLYLAFRILTHTRPTALPDHATPLRRAGFRPLHTHHLLFGLLTTEIWQQEPRTS